MHSQIYGCPLFPELLMLLLEPPFWCCIWCRFMFGLTSTFLCTSIPLQAEAGFIREAKIGAVKKTRCITYGYKRNFTAILWIVRTQFAQGTACFYSHHNARYTRGIAWIVLPYQRQTTNTSSDPTPTLVGYPTKCSTDH